MGANGADVIRWRVLGADQKAASRDDLGSGGPLIWGFRTAAGQVQLGI